MHLESLVITYGYPVLFVGILIEGEGFLILAAYLAHRGYFSLPVVVAIAAAAAFSITQVLFYLGDRYGTAFLVKRPAWRLRVAKVDTLLQRYGNGLVLGFRALFGLRTIIPVAIGAADFPAGRFVLLNAIGALGWALVVALAGNGISQVVEVLFTDLRRHELAVILVLTAVGLVWGLFRMYRHPTVGRPG